MQIGGGINNENASSYIQSGASHVIVTSYVFQNGQFNESNLQKILSEVGREKLILDLSCRIRDGKYWIVTDRWQKFTNVELTTQMLQQLSNYCDEFLVHAVDVEGLCKGIDWNLVKLLKNCDIPMTYAGGASSLNDLQKIHDISNGKVDLTIGSALDIFGGSLISYSDAVAFNKTHASKA
jgi:phosphoribosylformimino-5-aminoimidazole carboxamide ribotide isomerase